MFANLWFALKLRREQFGSKTNNGFVFSDICLRVVLAPFKGFSGKSLDSSTKKKLLLLWIHLMDVAVSREVFLKLELEARHVRYSVRVNNDRIARISVPVKRYFVPVELF